MNRTPVLKRSCSRPRGYCQSTAHVQAYILLYVYEGLRPDFICAYFSHDPYREATAHDVRRRDTTAIWRRTHSAPCAKRANLIGILDDGRPEKPMHCDVFHSRLDRRTAVG